MLSYENRTFEPNSFVVASIFGAKRVVNVHITAASYFRKTQKPCLPFAGVQLLVLQGLERQDCDRLFKGEQGVY
jgi:CTP synthase (UTP-ammonia lyase)